MSKVGKPVFFIVLALIAVLVGLAFFGVHTQYGDIQKTVVKGAQDIRWGIDIRGGVDVTFRPPEGYTATQDEMAAAESIIKVRLVSQNITDYEVYTDYDKNRIIVRFPWKEGETDFNPERAIQELGETARLTFREGVEMDAAGRYTGVTESTIILEGMDVASAQTVFTTDQTTGTQKPAVSLSLSSAGAQKFAEATTRLAKVGQISIWMDETVISAPSVESAITDGQALITGSFTVEAAKDLADKINAGALPFQLQTDNYNSISPTLGAGARDAMLLAGIIAFAAIAVFMIVFYRLPGFVAIIGLAGQIALIIASISGFFPNFPSFTLTLPGIAGIVLSIGCGVDANVITAERIKEELKTGKTLDGAIASGCKHSFTAILDGNITIIIVAIILMGAFGPPGSLFAKLLTPFFFMFGPSTTGTIYSFGYTLLMGVLFNFVMSIFATRQMLKSISKFKIFRNPRLYGDKKVFTNFRFIANSKRFFTLSGIIIALILVSCPILGVQLDIQFRGGSIVTYSYEGDMDIPAFESLVQELTAENVSFQQSTDIATGSQTIVVTMPGTRSLTSDQVLELTESIQRQFSQNNPQTESISNVDATIGKEFLAKCLVAVAVASVLMILFVAFRFRKIGGVSAGVMAVVALLHDVIVIFGVFVLFRIPLNDNFIAVVLTILGYSINDTIVIYDRIRENKRILGAKTTLADLVDTSINQSFRRSLNTSITTIMAMAVVTVVAYLYNVTSILSFSFPMILGLVSGAYSSICIAGPLWVIWRQYKLGQKA